MRRASAFRRAERRRARRAALGAWWWAKQAAGQAWEARKRKAIIDTVVSREIAWRAARRARIAELQTDQLAQTTALNMTLAALRKLQDVRPGDPSTMICLFCQASVVPQLDKHSERRCPMCRGNYDLSIKETRRRLEVVAKELARHERDNRGVFERRGRLIAGASLVAGLPTAGWAALYHAMIAQSSKTFSLHYVLTSPAGLVGMAAVAMLIGGFAVEWALGKIGAAASREVDRREEVPAKPAKPVTRPPTIWEAQEEQQIRMAQPDTDEAADRA